MRDNAINNLKLTGTTTIGVVCKDGVILASDTRVTMGFYIAHKQGKKVYKIDDHVAMTIAGTVADAQKTVDILKANAQLYKLEKNRPIPISSAARIVSNLLFSARSTLRTHVLVGGVDDKGSHVFSIDPFGSLTKEKFVSTGSGSPMALGVLEDNYSEDVTIANFLRIVVKAVTSSIKRDAASGDNYNIITITEKGYQELSEDAKKQLLAN